MENRITANEQTSLFLDRDGVLNEELPNDYVKTWAEFIFFPYTFEALKVLSAKFKRIVIVTNQKGVGRQLMTEDALKAIHSKMLLEINAHGGRIDKIYYCSAIENEDACRKPNPGMAFKAKADFPEIDLANSIMVGNNLSDMQFGKNAGMQTILVNTTKPIFEMPHPHIDVQLPNLLEVAKYF
jgi:D-glycero-D-manno-heptose 1,7-bisphosphate phosphatase